MRKGIAVLGSTGSIGRQALDVVSAFPSLFKVTGLAYLGHNDGEGLVKIAADTKTDIVVMAIVGTAGLAAVLAAIKKGKTIALASKEILVAAGDVVMAEAKKYKAQIMPLDSEHSAVFQCLQGQGARGKGQADIKRIILTASGGPFRKYSKKQLSKVTAKQALKHPTWKMGPKITIDCATLMNKGLEVIEAHHLFGIPYEKIEVVVHPQSVIHSMVEFVDGSILAQIGVPDMRTAIQYALTYPNRQPRSYGSVDFAKIGELKFEKPDTDKFPCLRLAYKAGMTGGTLPAVLSAANDSAVELFLDNKIGFDDIPKIVSSTMRKHKLIKKPKLSQILEAEKWARLEARKGI